MEKIHLKDDFIKLGQALKAGRPGGIRRGGQVSPSRMDRFLSTETAELQRGKKLYPGDVVSFGGKEFQIEK